MNDVESNTGNLVLGATRPDIFITGVMKGGTTILHEYICTHPKIVSASLKEIHYFSLYYDRGPEWYAEHFKDVPADCRSIDASPTYFDVINTPMIPRLIRAAAPDPRAIIITRDPVLRALSHFKHFQTINKLPELQGVTADEFFSSSFEDAFRQTGKFGAALNHVLNFSLYSRKLSTYRQVFDKHQLLVLDNDALRADAQSTMRDVFSFLNEDYVDNDMYGVVKYSNGSALDELSSDTVRKLADFLYADYRSYCADAGIEFKPLSPRPAPSPAPAPAPKQESKPSDMVHQGRDGWLFLVGGTNRVIDLYRHESTFTPDIAKAWVKLLETRKTRLAELGVRYVHLPAPEKLTIMHRYFDGTLESIEGSPIRKLVATYGDRLQHMVNPVDYMVKQSEGLPLYWKTDTHWSALGCFCAYQMLCSNLGVKSNPSLLEYPHVEGEALLDLSGKMEEPTREKARYYDLSKHSKRIHANELVLFKEENGLVNEANLHVGSHVVFHNDSETALDQKVVLFGDSFAEYRPQLLTGMLAETFREVHFIWNASIDYQYIEKVKPDIVITELAERFMTRVPGDDLCIETFAKERLASYLDEQPVAKAS